MYAGDVTPTQAFQALETNMNAVMVDVRTMPEWVFVGQPRIARMANIAWQVFPSMAVNPDFEKSMREAGISQEHEIYFLCRSGARSAAAAAAMTQAGFKTCYNISGGFEGDPDAQGHRGTVNGWKCEGLPWAQK